MSAYPCLVSRTYTGCLGPRCEAMSCWAGRHPQAPPPKLQPGQRACGHCGTPFSKHGRARYCTETCAYNAMMDRRRRREAGSQRGGQGRAKAGYASRNQYGSFWVVPR